MPNTQLTISCTCIHMASFPVSSAGTCTHTQCPSLSSAGTCTHMLTSPICFLQAFALTCIVPTCPLMKTTFTWPPSSSELCRHLHWQDQCLSLASACTCTCINNAQLTIAGTWNQMSSHAYPHKAWGKNSYECGRHDFLVTTVSGVGLAYRCTALLRGYSVQLNICAASTGYKCLPQVNTTNSQSWDCKCETSTLTHEARLS